MDWKSNRKIDYELEQYALTALAFALTVRYTGLRTRVLFTLIAPI